MPASTLREDLALHARAAFLFGTLSRETNSELKTRLIFGEQGIILTGKVTKCLDEVLRVRGGGKMLR